MSAGTSNADVLARGFIPVRPSRHLLSNVDRADPNVRIPLGEMAHPAGFEPTASAFGGHARTRQVGGSNVRWASAELNLRTPETT